MDAPTRTLLNWLTNAVLARKQMDKWIHYVIINAYGYLKSSGTTTDKYHSGGNDPHDYCVWAVAAIIPIVNFICSYNWHINYLLSHAIQYHCTSTRIQNGQLSFGRLARTNMNSAGGLCTWNLQLYISSYIKKEMKIKPIWPEGGAVLQMWGNKLCTE